jgi:hypothetical protein
MSGSFNPGGVRPTLAGAYFNWEAQASEIPAPSIGSAVAIPFVSDWGPSNTVVPLLSQDRARAVFGDSDTAGTRALYRLFKGEGWGGRGGAGLALAYRMVGTGGAKATKTLSNTTPAVAMTFTARYDGTRGNNLRLTVQAGAAAGTKDLIVLEGTRVLERFNHPQTNLASLAADVNALSGWVTATVTLDGVALADIASTALVGGNDGSTLTGTDWTAAMTALEAQRFSIFVPFDLTDPTIRTSVLAWQKAMNDRGQRCMTVLGAATADTMTTAVTTAKSINDPNVVYAAGFSAKALDLPNTPVLSPSQFAPAIAGAIAFRGESRDIIFTRFADIDLATGASLAVEEQALAGGVTTMREDTNATAPSFIREGVTTYTDDSASPTSNGVKTRPVKLYKRIKNMRIQHAVELEVDDWFTSGLVAGELAVNDRTRSIAKGHIQEILEARVTSQVVQPGFSVDVAADPPPSDDDDALWFVWGFHPTRSTRQMFNTIRLG